MGVTIGVIRGDTRSLDYGSYRPQDAITLITVTPRRVPLILTSPHTYALQLRA